MGFRHSAKFSIHSFVTAKNIPLNIPLVTQIWNISSVCADLHNSFVSQPSRVGWYGIINKAHGTHFCSEMHWHVYFMNPCFVLRLILVVLNLFHKRRKTDAMVADVLATILMYEYEYAHTHICKHRYLYCNISYLTVFCSFVQYVSHAILMVNALWCFCCVFRPFHSNSQWLYPSYQSIPVAGEAMLKDMADQTNSITTYKSWKKSQLYRGHILWDVRYLCVLES